MYERVYRYDKPVKDVFLDILNYTNKTAFTARQLVIGKPQAVTHTRTQVVVKPSQQVGWSGEVTLTYDRQDLGIAFSNVPLVIWATDTQPETLLQALKDQYQVLFSLEDVEVQPYEMPLTQAIPVTAMRGFTAVEAGLSKDELTVLGTPWLGNYQIQAKADNLVWVGTVPLLVRPLIRFMDKNIQTTLAMGEYFLSTLAAKVPIEIVVERRLDASAHSRILTALPSSSTLKTDSPFVTVAQALTGDAWVSKPQNLAFNLYNSKVLYNGHNTGTYFTGDAKYSHVFVLELDDQYCANLSGLWLLHYSDRNAHRFTDHRIDRGPMLGH